MELGAGAGASWGWGWGSWAPCRCLPAASAPRYCCSAPPGPRRDRPRLGLAPRRRALREVAEGPRSGAAAPRPPLPKPPPPTRATRLAAASAAAPAPAPAPAPSPQMVGAAAPSGVPLPPALLPGAPAHDAGQLEARLQARLGRKELVTADALPGHPAARVVAALRGLWRGRGGMAAACEPMGAQRGRGGPTSTAGLARRLGYYCPILQHLPDPRLPLPPPRALPGAFDMGVIFDSLLLLQRKGQLRLWAWLAAAPGEWDMLPELVTVRGAGQGGGGGCVTPPPCPRGASPFLVPAPQPPRPAQNAPVAAPHARTLAASTDRCNAGHAARHALARERDRRRRALPAPHAAAAADAAAAAPARGLGRHPRRRCWGRAERQGACMRPLRPGWAPTCLTPAARPRGACALPTRRPLSPSYPDRMGHGAAP
jgi:hypothetical protein